MALWIRDRGAISMVELRTVHLKQVMHFTDARMRRPLRIVLSISPPIYAVMQRFSSSPDNPPHKMTRFL